MKGLLGKIFMWFSLTVVVSGLTLVAATVLTGPHDGEERRWQTFLAVFTPAEGKQLAETFEREGQRGLLREFASVRKSGLMPYLFDENGTELLGQVAPAQAREFAKTAREDMPSLDRNLGDDRLAAQKIAAASGHKYTSVMIVPRTPFFTLLHGLGVRALLTFVALLLVAGGFCFWLARHISDPILKVGRAANEIASGQLHTRVGRAVHWRRDEIGRLAANFDSMAQRIESLVQSQRRMLGLVSHELRSPLARLCVALGLLRTCSEEQRTEFLDRIEVEANHLDKLIGQLLTLARIDGSADSNPMERVDIVNVVHEVAADGDFEARTRGCAVKVDSIDACYVTGVAEHLRQAIENVVRNAIRYTRNDTTVEITVRRQDSPARVQIQVRDCGPGVPDEHIWSIFRPFHRVPSPDGTSSDGAGLGLAITDRVVRMHSGSVRARNAPEGGLLVELEIPEETGAVRARAL